MRSHTKRGLSNLLLFTSSSIPYKRPQYTQKNYLINTPPNYEAHLIKPLQFNAFFPKLLALLSNFQKHVKLGVSVPELYAELGLYLSHFNEEIITHIPEWYDLLKLRKGIINFHIIRVMFCLTSYIEKNPFAYTDNTSKNSTKSSFSIYPSRLMPLPDPNSLCSEDKNILHWAILLHDIKKRGPPTIPTDKDPFHPYASAAVAVHVLERLAFRSTNRKQLKYSNAMELYFNDLNRLVNLINSAKVVREMTYFTCESDFWFFF
jgi:hypothetical protein